MEHQTGPDGPDGTEDAELAAGTQPGAPESGLGTDGAANHQGFAKGADDAAIAEHEDTLEAAESDPAAARPQSAPEPGPATGEPRVDAALKLLDRLPTLPVSEHAELYEQVHGQLSDVLGELDSGSAGPAGD